MTKDYKPKGYNSVSPYIIVKGADKMAELLGKIFDAKVTRRFTHEDGNVMHMEVMLDDSVIMIGGASADYPPNTSLIHLYVKDVDVVYKTALENGCEGLQEPVQKRPDDDKRGMFKDFSGNVWAVATQI